MLILVVGSGRCGSTPVAEIITRHPEVGFISNIDDKLALLDLAGRWNPALYRRSGAKDPGLLPLRDRGRLLERGRLRVGPSEAWNLLDRQVMPRFSTPCRDLVADDLTPVLEHRLRAFVDRRLEAQRTPHLLLHLTGWPRTGLLRAAFPDARVVHVVRDGRAVAASWLRMGWWDGYQGPSKWYLGPLPDPYQEEWLAAGRSFPLLAGLGWKVLMDAFEAARAPVPAGEWQDLRYEDLVAAPERHAGALIDFLGLDWSPAFAEGFRRCRIQGGRVDAYRGDLGQPDLDLLDASLAGHLRRWGYEAPPVVDVRAAPAPSPAPA